MLYNVCGDDDDDDDDDADDDDEDDDDDDDDDAVALFWIHSCPLEIPIWWIPSALPGTMHGTFSRTNSGCRGGSMVRHRVGQRLSIAQRCPNDAWCVWAEI